MPADSVNKLTKKQTFSLHWFDNLEVIKYPPGKAIKLATAKNQAPFELDNSRFNNISGNKGPRILSQRPNINKLKKAAISVCFWRACFNIWIKFLATKDAKKL